MGRLKEVSYKTGLELKKLGFDWLCFSYYTSEGVLQTIEDFLKLGSDSIKYHYRSMNSSNYMETICSAPELELANKWLRDKYDIQVIAYDNIDGYSCDIILPSIVDVEEIEWEEDYSNYDEALEGGIVKAIEHINHTKALPAKSN